MRFIQSTNKDNIEIVNIEQVQSLAFEENSILFFFCQNNCIWGYENKKDYDYDVKKIKQIVNGYSILDDVKQII